MALERMKDLFNSRLSAQRILPQRRLCNSLTHIHTLPDELLIKMLVQALNTDGRRFDRNLELAAICVRWANIFRSSPVFWAFLESRYSSERQDLLLKRSGSLSLDVSITFESMTFTPKNSAVFERLSTRHIRSLKATDCQQWSSKHISVLAEETLEELLLESAG